MLNITRSNRYQVQAQVDKVRSHFIQSARDSIAELYDLHRVESAAERFIIIDSLLADNKYLLGVLPSQCEWFSKTRWGYYHVALSFSGEMLSTSRLDKSVRLSGVIESKVLRQLI
jgi:hypothetical protein